MRFARADEAPMKIIVFGATGGTGRHLIAQALAAGHHVTAFARDSAAIAPRPGLTVVAGRTGDSDAVGNAIAGHDAVLCALGGRPWRRRARVCSTAMCNIAPAMASLPDHPVAELAQEADVERHRRLHVLQVRLARFGAVDALCNGTLEADDADAAVGRQPKNEAGINIVGHRQPWMRRTLCAAGALSTIALGTLPSASGVGRYADRRCHPCAWMHEAGSRALGERECVHRIGRVTARPSGRHLGAARAAAQPAGRHHGGFPTCAPMP